MKQQNEGAQNILHDREALNKYLGSEKDSSLFLHQLEHNCETLAKYLVAKAVKITDEDNLSIEQQFIRKYKQPFWETVRILKNFIGARTSMNNWTLEELEDFFINHYPYINNRQVKPTVEVMEGYLATSAVAGTGKAVCLGNPMKALPISKPIPCNIPVSELSGDLVQSEQSFNLRILEALKTILKS